MSLIPYSEEWYKLAFTLACSYTPRIYPCAKCQHPVIAGCSCTFCGDTNPHQTYTESMQYDANQH